MNRLIGKIYLLQEFARKAFYKLFREPFIKAALRSCGENVHIAEQCNFKGIGNISIGNGSSIGQGSVLWTTRANIVIEDKVFTGPNVTIITGNHRTNLIGKYMADVSDSEKEASDDEDVIIKKDVWIGANAVILKGVTIEEGCVIAAGAVVIKSTEPYGIYAGIPAIKVRDRFLADDLKLHLRAINADGQQTL